MTQQGKEAAKILIVDDEPFNLRVLKLKFENAGYQVLLAKNGEEGLEKFHAERPDVVITDINMPVMDGKEMCERLPETGDFFLLVMTASLEDDAQDWTADISGASFVQKPISPRELLEKIDRYLVENPGRNKKKVSVIRQAKQPIEDEKINGHIPSAEVSQDTIASELSTRYEELNLIYRIGQKLRLDHHQNIALTELIEDAAKTIHADICDISLKSKYGALEKNVPSSFEIRLSKFERALLKNFINEKFGTQQKAFSVLDTKRVPSLSALPPMRLMAGPIQFESSTGSGYMAFLRHCGKMPFSTGDMRLLAMLTGHASVITRNHELYEDLRNVLFSVVQSLGDTIEAKDLYTRGHTLRVSDLSVAIGREMNLRESRLEHLQWAGVLHDIGKIGIPGEILTKPGRLTDEEMAVMKEHPEIGFKILEHIDALQSALPAVRHHHEKFDGSGYPMGLKGRKIPLYARIVSVSDTYDSMTSTRPYRKALSHEFTLEEMRRVAGAQLDPEIVTIFNQIIEKDANLRCPTVKSAEKPAWVK